VRRAGKRSCRLTNPRSRVWHSRPPGFETTAGHRIRTCHSQPQFGPVRFLSSLGQPRGEWSRTSRRSGSTSVLLLLFCCCPLDPTCPLHRRNRPADGRAADGPRSALRFFLTQPVNCLLCGLPRLRRAQLRDAPPAGRNMVGEREPGRSGTRPTPVKGSITSWAQKP
jgi:hypothetical protein